MTGRRIRGRATALAAGLALSLCAHADWRLPAAMGTSTASMVQAGWLTPVSGMLLSSMDLGRWEEYTYRALLPDFAANYGFAVELDAGLLANHEALLLPDFAQAKPQAAVTFAFTSSHVPLSPMFGDGRSTVQGYGDERLAFERSIFTPGIRRNFSNGGALDVAAVFAQQGYATPGLGARTVYSQNDYPAGGEQVSGAGLRLGISSELAPGVHIDAAYQSRIDMDAFQNYRGVYAEPGDFDIPASANIGIRVQASNRASLSFDVQRVLYSEVSTFTTSLLPDRFLSLLGDSASPDFSWRDLTVYQLGWNFASSEDLSWNVRYSTSQQPTPTARSLARALEPDFADRSMSVGFTKRTGRAARLNFNASYAPSDYYLGNAHFARPTDLSGDQFEFEVIWVWDF